MNLITGGSGFVGINIARKLVERKERVRIIDILKPDSEIDNDIEYVPADIRNKNAVIKACKEVSYIYHSAALVPVSKAGKKRFWAVNVEGTRNVLEGALRFGIKKIIHISSSSVYNINQRNPLTEESSISPCGDYAYSKYEAERICYEYRKKGLDIVIVRPRAVVGRGRLGIYQILYDWIRRGKRIYIIGSGANRLQFIHIKDLVDAIILIREKTTNEIFNLGTDRFETLKKDLETLIEYAGTKSRIVSLNPALATCLLKILDKLNLSPLSDCHYLTYPKDFYLDVTRAKQILDWRPRYSNSEMLIESYQWYLKHFKEAERQTGITHRKSIKQKWLKFLRNIS